MNTKDDLVKQFRTVRSEYTGGRVYVLSDRFALHWLGLFDRTLTLVHTLPNSCQYTRDLPRYDHDGTRKGADAAALRFAHDSSECEL